MATNLSLLSLYEDNAGGLSLLRHADNTVFIGLECLYAGSEAERGQILNTDETQYWLNLDTNTDYCIKTDDWHYRHSDGHEFRHEPKGEDASDFDTMALIAEYDGAEWTTYPERMGSSGHISTGK